MRISWPAPRESAKPCLSPGSLASGAGLNTLTGSIPGYREEQAAWPRIWRAVPQVPGRPPLLPPVVPLEQLGLDGLEERWRQSQALAPHESPGQELVDWVPPWLNLAAGSAPRVPPLERAQARMDAGPEPPVLRPGFGHVFFCLFF